ncbi:type II secretion system minor pseudopilin GspI [Algimonas porphyrae]|uniref:Type II secretion system protein I n=1 Tax=Algimonas porphyrae TaxID=1128113 RepID=A0ABQ5V281_9PROT|nr:type II secretion system minor pseudopilin GspI [Algimonas porphyrae]GLQ21663.1 type II secretion system protein GspI [Algimonas porphyrae]
MTARDHGFTLIEVLVSLAIFSLAIVGLNRAATLAVSGASTLQLKTHAGFVADNAVVLSRIGPIARELGVERNAIESGGIGFDVTIETVATELADFLEIRVRVTQQGSDRVLIERRAFRNEALWVVAMPEGEAEDRP